MKQIVCFLFITIGIYTNSLNAQEIIWLNSNLEETTQDKADYYRIDAKLEGEITFYYKKRTLFRKMFYSKGKPNGLFYEYYETGELKETGVYENGLREGIWKEFYKGGKIKSKGKYTKGEKVGIWKMFYKNDK
ncbi:toxin-antitoxin system YwqK family antitoxin [Polaribacter sp.]|uniref:toxin-antitoxin system YwqK family antitoxin n=1 Tax=Polaribacter sp. TaxID=1920175 RepID=UPI004047D843